MKPSSGLSHSQILMVLSKIPFFRNFTSDERDRMAQEENNILIARPGETIVRKDSQGRAFYIILSGNVRIMSPDGESLIATLNPGEVFGEIAFLTGRPRICDVRAEGVTIVMKIDLLLMEKLRAEIREKIKDRLIDKLIARILED